MHQIASDYYAQQMRAMHYAIPTWGNGHPEVHLEAVMALNPTSVLDFGCGKGKLVLALRDKGIDAEGFDPGVPEWGAMSDKTFDLVTCLDVLEHVEPHCLEHTLDTLASAATRAYLAIAHFPAGRNMADGRNLHLTVQPPEWWKPLIEKRWEIKSWETREKITYVYATTR